jgi:hypothetical protein
MMTSVRSGPKAGIATSPPNRRDRAEDSTTDAVGARPKAGKTTVFLARIV